MGTVMKAVGVGGAAVVVEGTDVLVVEVVGIGNGVVVVMEEADGNNVHAFCLNFMIHAYSKWLLQSHSAGVSQIITSSLFHFLCLLHLTKVEFICFK